MWMTPGARPDVPDRAWFNWDNQGIVDLAHFITREVPELCHRPYTYEGLHAAELAAHHLFPDGPASDLLLADRWWRYVGRAFMNLLGGNAGIGEWANAPEWFPGERDKEGLLPVLVMPYGEIITSPLPVVLAVPAGDYRRGGILIQAVAHERTLLEAWLTAGRPPREVLMLDDPRL